MTVLPSGSRRVASGASLVLLLAGTPAIAFDFEEVAHRAQQLAAQPYRPQKVELPKESRSFAYENK